LIFRQSALCPQEVADAKQNYKLDVAGYRLVLLTDARSGGAAKMCKTNHVET
jgi:hypothetical protein